MEMSLSRQSLALVLTTQIKQEKIYQKVLRVIHRLLELAHYIVAQKGCHQTFGNNFLKSQPILKILSLTDSAGNFL